MKKIIFFATLAFIYGSSFGQSGDRFNTTKFSIGPTIGFAAHNPLKEVPGNKGWSLGAGGVLQLEHFFQENLSGVAQGGIISYAGRSSGTDTKNKAYTAVPLRFGANGYIGSLHLGALLGIGFNSFNGASATSLPILPRSDTTLPEIMLLWISVSRTTDMPDTAVFRHSWPNLL